MVVLARLLVTAIRSNVPNPAKLLAEILPPTIKFFPIATPPSITIDAEVKLVAVPVFLNKTVFVVLLPA